MIQIKSKLGIEYREVDETYKHWLEECHIHNGFVNGKEQMSPYFLTLQVRRHLTVELIKQTKGDL